MKQIFIHLILGLSLSLIMVSCETEPDPEPDPCPEPELVELGSNFSEAEFENAIIGIWNTAYEREGRTNVIFLCVNDDNIAKITIEENGASETFIGNLTVEYHRPTSPHRVTLAKVKISSNDEEIVLSDVVFDITNFLPDDGTLYLRNTRSPYATLKREVE